MSKKIKKIKVARNDYNNYMVNDFLGIYSDLQKGDANSLSYHYALFHTKDLYINFTCLNSNFGDYKQGHKYCFYKFPSLIRVLSLKCELITSELGKTLYQGHGTSVALIINWSSTGYSYVILDLKGEEALEQLSQDYELILRNAKMYIEKEGL